ncbi:spermatogenesis-associated protein 6 [Tachyglossus aculeatus]|uniref:spermatogenesis-associated protein 6 n=1 Tax=Tachyglossus aculeatus TaxID=9261 RepID=UPI0018F2DE48|nr:spermatogenesis-associated protein 6 [Tachyglossus aculeatus]
MRPLKALRLALLLHVRCVSCPGARLKGPEELCLLVRVLGQCQKTRCVPAVFPLVFNAEMVFEKVFPEAVDPGDVVAQLEDDSAVFELVQLVPPDGEILSTYTENTKDFLFPGPRSTSGPREVHMTRMPGIRGAEPKLEFRTTSSISECLMEPWRVPAQDRWSHPRTPLRASRARSPSGPAASAPAQPPSPLRGYERPTLASVSRSPSPYTRRRMCALAEETGRRLAHLHLGPFEFKRDSARPPFIVRHVQPPSPAADFLGSPARDCARDSMRDGTSGLSGDTFLLGSYRPKQARTRRSSWGGESCPAPCDSRWEEPWTSSPADRHSPRAGAGHRSAAQEPSQSPVLHRSSLRERFLSHSAGPANSDEIHQRIKCVLRRHRAWQRPAAFDESLSGKEELGLRSGVRRKATSWSGHLESSSPLRPWAAVSQDSSSEWQTSREATHQKKSHRAVFADNMGKIYHHMFRNASAMRPMRQATC